MKKDDDSDCDKIVHQLWHLVEDVRKLKKKFIKTSDGGYINPNLIYEFGVVPFDDVFLIMYWSIDGEDNQIPGSYSTEEEANKALDELLQDLL